jgi:hypothetical protein
VAPSGRRMNARSRHAPRFTYLEQIDVASTINGHSNYNEAHARITPFRMPCYSNCSYSSDKELAATTLLCPEAHFRKTYIVFSLHRDRLDLISIVSLIENNHTRVAAEPFRLCYICTVIHMVRCGL